MAVDLALSELPQRGRNTVLTVTVIALFPAPNTTMVVTLPPSITLVQGARTWQGDLPKGFHQFSFVLHFPPQEGNLFIDLEAESKPEPGVAFGRRREIYVMLTASGTKVSFDYPIFIAHTPVPRGTAAPITIVGTPAPTPSHPTGGRFELLGLPTPTGGPIQTPPPSDRR